MPNKSAEEESISSMEQTSGALAERKVPLAAPPQRSAAEGVVAVESGRESARVA